jgi:glutamine phosphoribosylpyrophosphate amidotransferase
MDGVSVYEARLNMGEKLAERILKKFGDDHDIDGKCISVGNDGLTSVSVVLYRYSYILFIHRSGHPSA